VSTVPRLGNCPNSDSPSIAAVGGSIAGRPAAPVGRPPDIARRRLPPDDPFMGQGAAQPIEDGAALAACLGTIVDPTEALRYYERGGYRG
jgi:hypothetical protein